MKTIMFVLYSFALLNCSNCNTSHMANSQDSIRAIQINYVIPLLSETGKLMYDSNINVIYYYKDKAIYQFDAYQAVSNRVENPDNDTMLFKVDRWDIKHQYLIYNPKQLYGYKFDSLYAKEGRKCLLDSFFKTKMIFQLDSFPIYAFQKDSLVERIKSKEIVLEKYMPKSRPNVFFPDSTYLYFSNNTMLKQVDFSFSKSADKERQMKLFKIRMINNYHPEINHPLAKLAKEAVFEMKEIPVENKSEIVGLLERFSKQ